MQWVGSENGFDTGERAGKRFGRSERFPMTFPCPCIHGEPTFCLWHGKLPYLFGRLLSAACGRRSQLYSPNIPMMIFRYIKANVRRGCSPKLGLRAVTCEAAGLLWLRPAIRCSAKCATCWGCPALAGCATTLSTWVRAFRPRSFPFRFGGSSRLGLQLIGPFYSREEANANRLTWTA